MTKPQKSRWSVEKSLPYLLIIAGFIALACAYIIMHDKLQILKDPTFSPGCDINLIVSCGSVMQSDQAEAFGIPNPLFGLVGFAVTIIIGVAMLVGAKFMIGNADA